MTELTVILCLWDGWKPAYDLSHVRPLARMLRAYVTLPLRVVLLTDGINAAADDLECDAVLPIPPELPLAPAGPANCYRRLHLLDPEYQQQFDSRWWMSVDLDTLVLEDVTAPLAGEAMGTGFGFVAQRALRVGEGLRPYSGGLFAVECGRHAREWQGLAVAEERIRDSGWVGSDQVYLSLALPGAPTLGQEHGFYHYDQLQERAPGDPTPRLVHFRHGRKPWKRASEAPDLYDHWLRFAD